MKKIILSLSVIVFVGALVIGATGAFFSDTETSTGNTFTAGAIDLKIDSEQHYNGNVCVDIDGGEGEEFVWQGNAPYPEVGTPCTGSWLLTDLTDEFVAVHKFFDFRDLKPGDFGENTISLHVDTNDAYMCAALQNVGEADNGQTEPEDLVDPDQDDGAELDEVLNFFAWVDEGVTPGFGDEEESEGDNIFQEEETVLGSATASELDDQVWALAEGGDDPIVAGVTGYIGLAWCVGEFDGNGVCDGKNVGNASQTDSWFTDIAFYVTQARNNSEFECTPELFDLGEPEQEIEFVKTFESPQNALNESLDRPYITWVINGDNIDFTFHNPSNFAFVFDYRVDDEAGTPHAFSAIVIDEGELNGESIGDEYNPTVVAANSSTVVNVAGTSKIEVGMRVGPEQNWFLDWIVFEAI